MPVRAAASASLQHLLLLIGRNVFKKLLVVRLDVISLLFERLCFAFKLLLFDEKKF